MHYDKGDTSFIATERFESGSTCHLEIFLYNRTIDTEIYGVCFEIKRKRTMDTFLKITGEDGIKPLLWAKKKILDFEERISEISYSDNISLFVGWDDSRRKKVYIRGLKNNGYRINNIDGYGHCLFKVLKRKGKAVV